MIGLHAPAGIASGKPAPRVDRQSARRTRGSDAGRRAACRVFLQGQLNPERGPLARLALDADPAAVGTDGQFAERQAQAGGVLAVYGAQLGLGKLVENPVPVRGRPTRASGDRPGSAAARWLQYTSTPSGVAASPASFIASTIRRAGSALADGDKSRSPLPGTAVPVPCRIVRSACSASARRARSAAFSSRS